MAFQKILAERLRKSLEFQKFDQVQLPANASSASVAIPLNRIKSADRLRYVSAVALKLTSNSEDALRLAQQIAKNLHSTIQFGESQPLAANICQDLQIVIPASGWIYLEISPASLNYWLQFQAQSPVLLLNFLPALNNTPCQPGFDRSSDQVFEVIHSYARCHSILRAADVELGDWRLALGQPNLLKVTTESVKWQPAEWQLIEHLVDILDWLAMANSEPDPQPPTVLQIFKLTYRLSQKFQAFYATWPPGRIAAQDRQILQQQLGLLLLTQRLLAQLLAWLNLPTLTQM